MAVFLLALVGAILVLMPSLPRRIAISLLVLFHLAGIVTAVTVVDPPNNRAPWISRQLMARVYRPYLSFVYMTNAYHFYSPEPGTPSVFKFCVYYSDGKYAWLQVPNKADSPIGMHYQRMLGLPEHSFNPESRCPTPTPSFANSSSDPTSIRRAGRGKTSTAAGSTARPGNTSPTASRSRWSTTSM